MSRSSRLLPWMTVVIGLAGLSLLAVGFGGDLAKVWADSGPVVAVALFAALFLLLGGPVLLILQATAHPVYAGPVLLATIALYVIGAILAFMLARLQHRTPRRWAVVSFLTPFVPGIVLALVGLRQRPRALPTPVPRYVPQPDAGTPRPTPAPVDTLPARPVLDQVTARPVVDLRSAEEQQMARKAQSTLVGEDEQLAGALVALIRRADATYETDRDAYSATAAEITKIGEHLCANGGSDRMTQVAYRVRALGGRSRACEFYWQGICGWMY